MSTWAGIGAGVAVALLAYAAFVVGLVISGRREQARALAGLVPDCIVLFRRLLADDRVGRRHKLLIVALIGYLAMPVDLVPDFIPVAGQLDDVLLVAFVLRAVLRGGGPGLVRDHWPGPPESLRVVLRLAGLRPPSATCDGRGRPGGCGSPPR